MPHQFKGERILMRIFLGESDRCRRGRHEGKPLWEAILLTLRDEGCAGATVTRGIAGFGASARLHTGKVLRLSSDLPLVVEVVEDEEKLDHILPVLDEMMGAGLVTMERVRVLMYRPGHLTDEELEDAERELHRADPVRPPPGEQSEDSPDERPARASEEPPGQPPVQPPGEPPKRPPPEGEGD